jgi:hypothetical protein
LKAEIEDLALNAELIVIAVKIFVLNLARLTVVKVKDVEVKTTILGIKCSVKQMSADKITPFTKP